MTTTIRFIDANELGAEIKRAESSGVEFKVDWTTNTITYPDGDPSGWKNVEWEGSPPVLESNY